MLAAAQLHQRRYVVAVSVVAWQQWHRCASTFAPGASIAATQQHMQQRADGYYKDKLRTMVGVNSFTGNRAGIESVEKLTKDLLRESNGFGEAVRTQCDEDPNYGFHLQVRKPASERTRDIWFPWVLAGNRVPSVALVGHLDTVFPPEVEAKHNFRWRELGDGTIVGPGVVDIKGGNVAMAMTLEAVRLLDPRLFETTSFHAWYNAAEEVGAADFAEICSSQLAESMPQEDLMACMVYEFDLSLGAGSDTAAGEVGHPVDELDEEVVDEVPSDKTFHYVCQRKGMCVWSVDIAGREAHAGNLHAFGRSAIHAAADLIHAAHALTDYDQSCTFNVGTIAGGTATNTVAGHTTMTIEMRAPTTDVFNAAAAKFEDFCANYRHPGMEDLPSPITASTVAHMQPWPENEGSQWMLRHLQQAGQRLGYTVLEQHRGGLSDGNRLFDMAPCIDGCGLPGAHPHCAVQDASHGKHQEMAEWHRVVPKVMLNALGLISMLRERFPEYYALKGGGITRLP